VGILTAPTGFAGVKAVRQVEQLKITIAMPVNNFI